MTALAAAVAAAAQPEGRWTPLGESHGATFDYDAASVRRTGTLVRFRLRMLEEADRRSERHRSIAQTEIDCRGRTIAYLSFERFDGRGESLGIVRPSPPDRTPVYAGQFEGRVYQRLCPAAIARPLPRFPGPPIMTVPSPPPVMIAPPAPPPPPFLAVPPPPPPPPPAGRNRRAQWRAPPHSLISGDDYPAAALRAEQQGRVGVRLTVSRSGIVQRCTVMASSGSAALDVATCRLLERRARFIPARDARGRPTTDSVDAGINWRIPSD